MRSVVSMGPAVVAVVDGLHVGWEVGVAELDSGGGRVESVLRWLLLTFVVVVPATFLFILFACLVATTRVVVQLLCRQLMHLVGSSNRLLMHLLHHHPLLL